MTATTTLMLTNERCPECGSRLELDPACVIEEPYVPKYPLRSLDPMNYPRRTRIAPAALCTGCEFCIEVVWIDAFEKALDAQIFGGAQ
jgi:hypothetical protein